MSDEFGIKSAKDFEAAARILIGQSDPHIPSVILGLELSLLIHQGWIATETAKPHSLVDVTLHITGPLDDSKRGHMQDIFRHTLRHIMLGDHEQSMRIITAAQDWIENGMKGTPDGEKG